MNRVRARLMIAGVVMGLLLSMLLVLPLGAAPQDLPPRPTPIPLEPLSPQGGQIKLVAASPTGQEMWTMIQWQDALGEWHDVDGWQGNFNASGMVVWYVGPENLDTGPYRWLVYQNQGGILLDTSDPFDMPENGGQMVTVEVLPEL